MDHVTTIQSTASPTRKQIAEKKRLLKLSREQREVLVGLLLGDGHLSTQDNSRTYRLVYSQSKERHGAYLERVYGVFQDWTLGWPVLVKGHKGAGDGAELPPGRFRTKDRLKFTTVAHGSLRFYGKAFYKGGVKVVPKGIGRLLTARGLAYWYMDDGSIKSRQSKGLILNTHSFTLAEVELLCKVLGSNFGLQAKPRPQTVPSGGQRHQIYISGRSYERGRKIIGPHLLPEMMYKFPPPRKLRGANPIGGDESVGGLA
jgi:hypothetical protein|uniref:Putative LAGLIDADG homing endonuclease n=1 Tax=Trebouxiophyceae sp. MX-AZ01 TaxID=1208065 RepID=J7KEE4_9CHLO|nr:putative LAGLIDADG homing endonuclease [Trebouxiophyceae sp. MX-AZ01]AFQ93740.1 putative LAGLIDADG homing endonuclease [Trebouxiophyceae sp. MX-AZ01]